MTKKKLICFYISAISLYLLNLWLFFNSADTVGVPIIVNVLDVLAIVLTLVALFFLAVRAIIASGSLKKSLIASFAHITLGGILIGLCFAEEYFIGIGLAVTLAVYSFFAGIAFVLFGFILLVSTAGVAIANE